MMRLLRADFARLWKSRDFRLALAAMLALAAGLMAMQGTAMDYAVPLSRVIFLPLSVYGVVMAAFVSAFVGTDFSDGFIRNKLLATARRDSLVISQIIVSGAACAIVYALVTAFSAGVGQFFFENNVDGKDFALYCLLGMGMSLTMGCLFCVVTLLCGNKTRAIVVCMGLAFGMLFLCLHTNGILVQAETKNGALNPNYVGGLRRVVCSVLHDLNPYGQAAQLSAWMVWHPVRGQAFNMALIVGLVFLGCRGFRGKDIQ